MEFGFGLWGGGVVRVFEGWIGFESIGGIYLLLFLLCWCCWGIGGR